MKEMKNFKSYKGVLQTERKCIPFNDHTTKLLALTERKLDADPETVSRQASWEIRW
jgi:hypothetical protein